jgi:exopolysaccharide production protein ExoQ
MQQLTLFSFLLFIFWLFARETKRRVPLSGSLWVVVVFLVIVGSRAVSTWFEFGREVGGEAEAYDQGNPLERNVYFVLLGWGLVTLWKRQVRLGEVLRYNPWLSAFFIYWLFSVLWAELPFVAFKRWVKDVGYVVMVLVVLTEQNPVEAAKGVFIRCGCLLIPLSVLFIKYYSELGRAYHSATGEMMFTGVATHKNTLGIMVMVCGLFLMWDFLERFSKRRRPLDWLGLATDVVLLGMTLWLLVKSHSATSLACTVLGVAIFLGFKTRAVRTRILRLEVYALVGAGVILALDSMFGLSRFVVEDVLGRDMTLTTRTQVWPELLSMADSALFGAGFNSFWSGERLEILYARLGIIQAHNGYLEMYLNGGWIAVVLFVGLIFSARRRIKLEIQAGGDFPIVRFIFVVIGLIHNFTEASINKGGLLWFVLLLSLVESPSSQAAPLPESATPLPADGEPTPADFDEERAPVGVE